MLSYPPLPARANIALRIASGKFGHDSTMRSRAGSMAWDSVAGAPDIGPPSAEIAVFAWISGRVRIPPSPLGPQRLATSFEEYPLAQTVMAAAAPRHPQPARAHLAANAAGLQAEYATKLLNGVHAVCVNDVWYFSSERRRHERGRIPISSPGCCFGRPYAGFMV